MAAKCSLDVGGNCSRKELAQSFGRLNGIRTLAESGRFKGWLLDQFGVLHDGKKPYPGVISTLKNLANNGAIMVVISNSSRRASITIDKLKGLGLDPSLFLGVVTSGELTHQRLQRRDDPWFSKLGRCCIHITWCDRGAISLDGLGLQVVSMVDAADFILVHGTEAFGLPSGDVQPTSTAELEQFLQLCSKRKIPMVVANPDFVTVEARDLRVMPGALADKYEKLGGEVKWMGKPDKVIYKEAMAMTGLEPRDFIAIGDSLHHDIKGANNAGIESVLITGGIHVAEFGLSDSNDSADSEALQALTSKYDAYPSYVLPTFSWANFSLHRCSIFRTQGTLAMYVAIDVNGSCRRPHWPTQRPFLSPSSPIYNAPSPTFAGRRTASSRCRRSSVIDEKPIPLDVD